MRKFILMAAAILTGFAASAQGAMQQLPNDPEVRKGTLDNGLTYYIRHNAIPEQRAEFYLATNVGAIQETPDQDGLAHFLEHMCFNGTKNFPGKGILDWLQSIGASFGGNVNASTGIEETQYMLNNIPLVRQTVIDTCLLILHDYSHFVTNDPVEIDKERPVIIEERRARRNASWRTFEKSLPYYYGDCKYASCTLIGRLESLEGFNPESLEAFYRTWYTPDKQAVIVVGDVDVDYVEDVLRRTFADIPAAEDPARKEVIKVPDNKEPVIGILTDPETSRTTIEVLWKGEAMPEEMNATLAGEISDLAKDIISTVMSERFTDITAKPDAPFLSGYFGIGNLTETCEAAEGSVALQADDVLGGFEAFMTELEKMRRYGFNSAEVERAKANVLSIYESKAQKAETRKNPEFVRPLLQNFFDGYAYMDPQTEFELVSQLMPMLSTEVINQAAQGCVTDTNMVVIYSAPEKESLTHPTEAELLGIISKVKVADIEPNAEEVSDTELLDEASLGGGTVISSTESIYGSTELTLSNGAKIVLFPSDREKDRITFDLREQGGESLIDIGDIDSFDGNVQSVFFRNSGVAGFSGTDLSKALTGKNVSVSPYINEFDHGIAGSSTVKDIETAFQLMYLYFTSPRFDSDEYDTGIKTLRSILPNLTGTPNYVLTDRLYKTLYGEDNPRMRMISESTLDNASLATLKKWYCTLFSDANGSVTIISGDFTIEDITPLVVKYFGSLPTTGAEVSGWVDDGLRNILPGDRTDDFTTDMQTPQTTVYGTYVVDAPFSYELHAALAAAEYILDMRYVTSLREDEGGTYGASVSFSLEQRPREEAVGMVIFNCKPSSADRLREVADRDFRSLGEEGPTAEEFDMAVKNMQKRIPENRQTNRYWSSRIREYYDHGADRDKGWEAAVGGLTAEKVREAAALLYGGGSFIEVIQRPGASAESE